MRRKGERPYVRTWPAWGVEHPVYRAVAEGEMWFRAWYGEAATPFVRLKKLSGVGYDRINAIDQGDKLTWKELVAFAEAWKADPEQVVASLPSPDTMVE